MREKAVVEGFVNNLDGRNRKGAAWHVIFQASTIVAISSIHLLQVFLNVARYTNEQLMWLTLMHLTFVVSALFLAFIDKIMAMTKKEKDAGNP